MKAALSHAVDDCALIFLAENANLSVNERQTIAVLLCMLMLHRVAAEQLLR